MGCVKVTKLEAVAQLVKRSRASRALSLRAVAKRAKVTAQTVMVVEKGGGSINVALAVMKALGIGRTARVSAVLTDVERIAKAA